MGDKPVELRVWIDEADDRAMQRACNHIELMRRQTQRQRLKKLRAALLLAALLKTNKKGGQDEI